MNIEHQKSFIGGVPTDNIIEILDEEEDIIERRLLDINEENEPEREVLNMESDDQESDGDIGLISDEDEENEGTLDNGLKIHSDP